MFLLDSGHPYERPCYGQSADQLALINRSQTLVNNERPQNNKLLTLSVGHYREISDLDLDVLTLLLLGPCIKASV